MQQTLHQQFLRWIIYSIVGFLALGNLFDAINNAIVIVTPIVTYVGSLFILIIWCSTELTLWYRPLKWNFKSNQSVRITGLGTKPRLAILGAIFLLWVPRLVNVAATDIANNLKTPAHRTIAGWIVEEGTGKAIAHARIILPASDDSAATNKAGYFRFTTQGRAFQRVEAIILHPDFEMETLRLTISQENRISLVRKQ